MRIDTKFLGLATAYVVAAVFTICSLIVAIAPGALSAFVSYALHIDITGIARPITFTSYLVGIVFIAVVSGVLVAAVAGLYNGLRRRRVVGVVAAH
jgi:hypothetical protein